MRSPESIVQEALDNYPIRSIYVGFSGGKDSLAITHWMMENVPNTIVFHANTGIGIEQTHQYVRDTCNYYNWPLTEIHAKHDCGQDYEELVKAWGFPGPPHHTKMYNRLKERCVERLLKYGKQHHFDNVIIATGIRNDESFIRAGYAGQEVNKKYAQVWVNPIYWWTKQDRDDYIINHKLPVNPVIDTLGMSGECLCGAFARPGEKEKIRQIEPEAAQRIDRLEEEVHAHGHHWDWEEEPVHKKKSRKKDETPVKEQIMCTSCNKDRNTL